MGERARRINALQLQRNRIGLKRADPNRQEARAALFLKHNNSVLGHQADTDAIDSDFNHIHSISCSPLALGVEFHTGKPCRIEGVGGWDSGTEQRRLASSIKVK